MDGASSQAFNKGSFVKIKENQKLIVKELISEDSQSRFLGRGASLVAQWLRICLPMQGTWVRALVWEDPTCRGATKPVSHNY